MKRTLENLILTDEDFICYGDLTITGEVKLINSNLIVSGILCFKVLNNEHFPVVITGGDICAYALKSDVDIYIRDGDIWAMNLDSRNIDSDSDIEVLNYADTGNIRYLNYYVSSNNESYSITAVQDVYILGNNNSFELTARDIFINGLCDTGGSKIVAKSFKCSRVDSITPVFVG